MRIFAADSLKDYTALSDKAVSEPVTITRDGHDHLVPLSIGEYERLKCRDRRVRKIEDFTAAEMEAIAKAEVPAEYAYLDDELKDWKP